MTELDLHELERVASAATNSSWGVFRAGVDTGNGTFVHERAEAGRPDSEHVAKFDPPTALALIRRIRELESEAKTSRTSLTPVKMPTTGTLLEKCEMAVKELVRENPVMQELFNAVFNSPESVDELTARFRKNFCADDTCRPSSTDPAVASDRREYDASD